MPWVGIYVLIELGYQSSTSIIETYDLDELAAARSAA